MPGGDRYEGLRETLNAVSEQARLPGKFVSIGAQKAKVEAGEYFNRDDLAGFFSHCNPVAIEIPRPTGPLYLFSAADLHERQTGLEIWIRLYVIQFKEDIYDTTGFVASQFREAALVTEYGRFAGTPETEGLIRDVTL